MAKTADLFTVRKGLDEICTVPDKIISVYALEQHVWADSHSEAAIRARAPELQTIREFQIDPVRPFLNDIFRNMAAPYKRERKDSPIGQGYWIQAEFGSGKSHLLCFLAALTLGSKARAPRIPLPLLGGGPRGKEHGEQGHLRHRKDAGRRRRRHDRAGGYRTNTQRLRP